MLYLFIVSLIWAFSFGLIKSGLAGVDSNFVAGARLGIALLVFLPFFRPGKIDRRTALRLVLTGAVQYGGMYIAYLYSFRYLNAYEVALFTIFTPLYVTLIHDWLEHRVNWVSLGAVLLTMVGTWIVQGAGIPRPGVLAGFLFVQLSNLCFAFGQIDYRRLLAGRVVNERQIYALPYLGGFLTASLSAVLFTPWARLALTTNQWLDLFYLGAVASGLGFFLWNVGARRVDAGTLAVFNDLKVPLATVVSLVFFGEHANLLSLLIGGGLGGMALWVNRVGRGWVEQRKAAV
jgi:drug/metabolite transporter (DMT)-like permease